MPELHQPAHPVRFVTAASLFDGHDAAINIMRRILQRQGAEVVHLVLQRRLCATAVDDRVVGSGRRGLGVGDGVARSTSSVRTRHRARA